MSRSQDGGVIRPDLSGGSFSVSQKTAAETPYLVGGVSVLGDPIRANDWKNGG